MAATTLSHACLSFPSEHTHAHGHTGGGEAYRGERGRRKGKEDEEIEEDGCAVNQTQKRRKKTMHKHTERRSSARQL